MAQLIRDVMTPDPLCLDANTTVREAAEQMRAHDIGDVLVTEDRSLRGIVTDRDIVVRCVAEGRDPSDVTLGSLCSTELATLSPEDEVGDAVRLMTSKSVRRIPVIQNQRPVGIVSLGDLAIELDQRSALGHISSSPAQH